MLVTTGVPLETRVAELFRLEPVDWSTFCRHVHRRDVRREGVTLLYVYEPEEVSVAEQRAGVTRVVRTLLEHDLRSLV